MSAGVEQFFVDHRAVIYFVIIAINYITGCIQIYGLFRFRNIDRLLIIQKRYPRLVMMEAILCCICLIIMSPIVLNSDLHAFQYPSHLAERIMLYFGIVLEALPLSTVVIEACRIWLISFDLHFIHSSKNQQWKSQINVNYALKDWYLRNRLKWGNQRYVVRWAILYYTLTAAIVMTLHITFEALNTPEHLWIFNSANAVAYLCPIAFVFYLFAHCPKGINDQMLMEFEKKWTVILLFCGVILYIISTGLLFVNLKKMSFTLTALLMVCCVYSSSLLACALHVLTSFSMFS